MVKEDRTDQYFEKTLSYKTVKGFQIQNKITSSEVI
jgi:hypothetical protein